MTISYKGYVAHVEMDQEDEIFVGHIAGITDRIGFHADTVADLKTAFREAVDDYLETCNSVGKEPDKQYTGKVMFRWTPETHRKAALAAEISGQSLTQWTEQVVGKAAEQKL